MIPAVLPGPTRAVLCQRLLPATRSQLRRREEWLDALHTPMLIGTWAPTRNCPKVFAPPRRSSTAATKYAAEYIRGDNLALIWINGAAVPPLGRIVRSGSKADLQDGRQRSAAPWQS